MKKLYAKKDYSVGEIIVRILYKLFKEVVGAILLRTTKIDNQKILFISRPAFSDNSKVLYNYLFDSENEYRFVWLVDKYVEGIECEKTKVVVTKKKPFYMLKEVMTSKVIFFTHESPLEQIRKRPEQLVINLWHGCGYKNSVVRGTPWVVRKKCDYSLVPGPIFVETKSKVWGCGKDKIWPLGYPRYDLLKEKNSSAKCFAEELMGKSNKLIIWMPTFRQSTVADYPEAQIESSYDLPLIGSEKELNELNEFCKNKNVTICIKRHISQKEYSCENEHMLSNIKVISDADFKSRGIELYSYLDYTSALISDYSSVAIDYLLLDKPIAFSLQDYEQYRAARGFVFERPLDYMPGHHLYNLKDLFLFVEDVANGNDKFKYNRDELLPQVHNISDNYCRIIWERIQEIL